MHSVDITAVISINGHFNWSVTVSRACAGKGRNSEKATISCRITMNVLQPDFFDLSGFKDAIVNTLSASSKQHWLIATDLIWPA